MHVIANSLLTVVLNRYPRVKIKASNNCNITEKKCSKKAQKLLKIEPTAELVNHCLSISVFTLQIALEKINLGSLQIDFERCLYCDY